jgi:hypothetical protein
LCGGSLIARQLALINRATRILNTLEAIYFYEKALFSIYKANIVSI